MKFTFILPSCRPNKLKRSVRSILNMSSRLSNVSMQVAVDKEDTETLDTDFGWKDLTKHLFNRQDGIGAYYNALIPHIDGDVAWIWSDENVLVTPKWDKIAEKLIKRREVWLGSTLDYVVVDGKLESSGHPNTGERFSCFPMMSKKAIEALGYVHYPMLRVWGADLFNHMLFKQAELIIDMKKIEVVSERTMDKSRIDIYHEDIERMIKAGVARREGDSIAYNITNDWFRLRMASGIPRMYRLTAGTA